MDSRERLDNFEESLRMALEGWQAGLQTAMPGAVVGVDLDAQTVSVQPALQATITDKDGNTSTVTLPVLVDVPITWPRAGGFALTFPVAVGDEVLVVFGSRCIDSWWQNGGVQPCADARMHDLSDAFAILAPTSQPKKLANVSATNVQLRGEVGTTYLEITPTGKIQMVAATEIKLTAPTITMNATNINMTAIVNIIGTLFVSGLATLGSMISGGIAYVTHKHGGVQTGTGDSDVPKN